MATFSPPRALSLESSFGGAADTFSHVASLSSTPPTTLADSMSLASEASKQDQVTSSDPIEETVQESPNFEAPAELAETDTVAEAIEVTTAPVEAPEQTVQEKSVEIAEKAPEKAPEKPTEMTATPSVTVSETPVETRNAPASASRRPRRERASLPTYNLSKLSGYSVYDIRRSQDDNASKRIRRTSSHALGGNVEGANADASTDAPKSASKPAKKGADALKMHWSFPGLERPKPQVVKTREPSPEPKRIGTRASTGGHVENLVKKMSTLGKRSRKTFEQGADKMTREMKRLLDTNEFAGIETKPVLYTTWAKGKLVTHQEPEPTKKKRKVSESPKKESSKEPIKEPEAEALVEEAPIVRQRRVKRWMEHGIFSGQEAPLDISKHLTPNEKKLLTELPELVPSGKVNKVMPLPMYNGLRTLIRGRDFKLPFDVCHPLPPGQPKPDEWRKMTRNRFVGNASAIWKKMPHFNDYQSKCVCTPEDGCTESCQNRIMLYECDNTNCNAGAAHCQNRAFARLSERTKAGGKYRVGVEVIKTKDRGYGIRSNRCFAPHQIIMEYTGEIITEEECDRRMNEKYKDNQCYYLMSFDQNMIIDATTGSIARFVNHSCTPNCRMIKWVVSGQPRMALFAGDCPIMTGEELTYDYNFDPFSAKNVQKCLCGSANCRGVLGPKSKEVKPPKPAKEEVKKNTKNGVKAGKRKLQELLRSKIEVDDGSAAKKRKIKTPTGVKGKGVTRSISETSLKAAKGAAKVVKRSVSTISVSAKAALGSKSPAAGRKLATIKHKSSVVKTYSSKAKVATGPSTMPKKAATKAASVTPKKSTSRKSSLTIVAAPVAAESNPASASTENTPVIKKSGRKPYTPTGRPRGRPRKYPRPEEVTSNNAESASQDGAEIPPADNETQVHESSAPDASVEASPATDASVVEVVPVGEIAVDVAPTVDALVDAAVMAAPPVEPAAA